MSDVVKVCVREDEQFPVYSYDETPATDDGIVVETTPETLERWAAVELLYSGVQEEMRQLYHARMQELYGERTPLVTGAPMPPDLTERVHEISG